MTQPWILIPVHNRRELTLACLDHLTRQADSASWHLAVIDDGSTDGTADAIRGRFPAVTIVPGDGNLWWTGAIRRGMQVADRAAAPAVVWLNDDCLPDPGAIANLVERATVAKPALVGAVCLAERSTPVPTAFSGRTALTAPPAGRTETAVDGLSGFCVAVPRAVWTQTGFPDAEKFPHYYGDTAYTLSARRAGFDVVLLAAARAALARYRERAHSIREFRQRSAAAGQPIDRNAIFRSPRSPFRAATQWNYLRLRYGSLVGSFFALARLTRWHASLIRPTREAR